MLPQHQQLKIVSGGQTGADRAALDWAIAHKIPHAGWCPQGRLAEDGRIPTRYHLRETPDANPEQRTEWNVRDSEGTVIFSINPQLTGGTKYTAEFAAFLNKPLLHLSSGSAAALAARLRDFVGEHQIRILNIAGPRASEEPAIAELVNSVLDEAFD